MHHPTYIIPVKPTSLFRLPARVAHGAKKGGHKHTQPQPANPSRNIQFLGLGCTQKLSSHLHPIQTHETHEGTGGEVHYHYYRTTSCVTGHVILQARGANITWGARVPGGEGTSEIRQKYELILLLTPHPNSKPSSLRASENQDIPLSKCTGEAYMSSH